MTFRFSGKLREEMFGNHQLEHGITKKFKPLIIEMVFQRFVPKTGMCQRLRQKQRIAKLVADAFLDRIHETKGVLTDTTNYSKTVQMV